MKSRKTLYAVTTVWVAGVMTVTGVLSIAHTKNMMEGFAHLGYPAYFANLLGVAKLLGVCALLLPGLARVKEWAYAGFAIVIVSASYSHLSSGDGLKALEPLATLAALAISYWARHVDRRVFFFPRPPRLGPGTLRPLATPKWHDETGRAWHHWRHRAGDRPASGSLPAIGRWHARR